MYVVRVKKKLFEHSMFRFASEDSCSNFRRKSGKERVWFSGQYGLLLQKKSDIQRGINAGN